MHTLELWALAKTKPDPQAVGFWENIWPTFRDQLAAEVGEKQAA